VEVDTSDGWNRKDDNSIIYLSIKFQKQMKKKTLKVVLRGAKARMSRVALLGAMMAVVAPFASSCNEDEEVDTGYKTYPVTVQLVYPEGHSAKDSVTVSLRNTLTGGGSYEALTNAEGLATLEVIAGTYEAAASEQREDEYYRYNLNALKSDISITETWTGEEAVRLEYTVSATPQLSEGDPSPNGRIIIKELYNGGCQKDDGSGAFNNGAYLILHNNSTGIANLKHLTVATTLPSNAHATNNFLQNGVLSYAAEGWIPAGFGVFYFSSDVELAPGEDLVVAINSAIDNTTTYSQAINFANPKYWAIYDPESGYSNATYYPAPAVEIPESHYLKAKRLANVTANAYVLSVNSPALFLFVPQDLTPVEMADDVSRLTTHGTSASQAVLKVPTDWVVDGIEVFMNANLATSNKRLTPDVDGGYVPLTVAQGYTLYRNVDKAATESIAANAGKLIYAYALGTADIDGGTTDPSGIDAEASIKNGARIIYKDTNSSANDFHQRKRASLRD
jgi:hypothetical protein